MNARSRQTFEVESGLAENWTGSRADMGGSDLSLQDTLGLGARLHHLCIRESLTEPVPCCPAAPTTTGDMTLPHHLVKFLVSPMSFCLDFFFLRWPFVFLFVFSEKNKLCCT